MEPKVSGGVDPHCRSDPQRLAEVKIIIRADSGFCRDELMSWCEDEKNGIDYVLGLAKNARLKKEIAEEMNSGSPVWANPTATRVFKDFDIKRWTVGAVNAASSARPSGWRKAPILDSS